MSLFRSTVDDCKELSKSRPVGFIGSPRTLNVKMNRHLVAAVSVGRDAEVSSAVLATGADETENADGAVGGVVLLQSVTIVG